MDSNEILFIGIGQAGNNIASEVVKFNKRINGVCINTSQDDVRSIENIKRTFIVPGAKGTGRNRNKAKMYVKDQIYGITDILKEYPQQKHLYISFSMGGGTGSGITPALLAVLAKMNPSLVVNIVPVLPCKDESKKAHENTLACWNELVKLPNVGAIYLIDNNKRKTKSAINKEFAILFRDFLNSTSGHKDGVMDGAELEILGTTKGLNAIYRLDNYIEEPKNLVSEEVVKSIFVVGNAKCQYLGLSIPEGFDAKALIDIYNVKEDYFIGYTDENPLLIVSGVPANASAVSSVKETLDTKNELLHKNEEEDDDEEIALTVDFEPSSKPEPKAPVEEKSIDDLMDNEDDFWNDVLNM